MKFNLKNKKFYILLAVLLFILVLNTGSHFIYSKMSLKKESEKIEQKYLKKYSRKVFVKSVLKDSDYYNKIKMYNYINNNFDNFLKINENLSTSINNYVSLYENAFGTLNNLKKMKAFSSKDIREIKKFLNSFQFSNIISKLAYINLKNSSGDILAEKNYFEGMINELKFDYQQAKNLYVKAKELNSYKAKYYNNLGIIYYRLYDFTNAINTFENGLNIANFSSKKDKIQEIIMLHNLAKTYSILDNKNKAFTNYTNMLVNSINSNNENYEWKAIYNLAFIEANLGNYDTAIDYLKYALKLSTKIRNKEYIANSLNALSKIYYRYGDYNNGVKNGLKAIKFSKKIFDLRLMSDSSLNVCLNYEYLYSRNTENNLSSEMVDTYCGRALKINDTLGKVTDKPEYYIQNGFIYAFVGSIRNYDKSIIYYNIAYDISRKYELLLDESEVLLGISSDNISLNKFDLALKELNESQKIKKSLNINSRLNYECKLGFIYWMKKDYNKSLDYYSDALLLAYRQENNLAISLISSHMASINFEIENYSEALKFSILSLEVNKKIYKYDHHYINYQSMWTKNIMDKVK